MKFTERPLATARLFCLPSAGGGASAFREWSLWLDSRIELLAIQLPGRENRILEEPLTTMEAIVDSLLAELRPLLDKPYVVYGHSMGAKIGYEVIHRILERGWPPPVRFFASGAPAPHLPRRKPPISELPTSEFLERLRDYDGTPQQVLENKEFADLFLPMLRADFGIVETYRSASDREKLPVPTSVLGGRSDPEVDSEELEAWAQVAQVEDIERLPGGHFFIKEHYRGILDRIAAALAA